MRAGSIWFGSTSVVCSLALALSSCDTPQGTAAAAAGGFTVLGARTPAQELEQTYYVGTFDPQEQLPPAVYRLTVRGQASFLSRFRFASGWVPASVIDGLGAPVGFGADGRVTVGDPAAKAGIATGRRMMLFGPEGFREAPADHRLVLVMSSSPEDFFEEVSNTLEGVATAEAEALDGKQSRRILEELYRLRGEERDLERIEARLAGAREEAE